MTNERIHRAMSRDGTEIAGRVYGQGPPLVLVHGAMDDAAHFNNAVGRMRDLAEAHKPAEAANRYNIAAHRRRTLSRLHRPARGALWNTSGLSANVLPSSLMAW